MKLIIGLGTGRCGTTSLSYFLSAQPGFKVLHEGLIDNKNHPHKWENDQENVLKWIEYLRKRFNNYQYIGDVGMYFLNYVPFLIDKFPDMKFICLKRDREKTIKSFLSIFPKVNFWYEHDGSRWVKHEYDDMFPKFNEPDKAKAVGLYWDMYYKEIAYLQEKYPQNIRCVLMESLNSISGRNEILDFIEYRGKRKVDGRYKYNSYFSGKLRQLPPDITYETYKVLNFIMVIARRILPHSVRDWLWHNVGKHLYQ